MRSLSIFSVILVLLATATSWGGEPATDGDYAARMNRLEAETQALRDEVQRLREHPVRLPGVQQAAVEKAAPDVLPNPVSLDALAAMQVPANPLSPAESGGAESAPPQTRQIDGYTISELREEMKKCAWSKGDFKIVPYGWLWANAVYSTERTNPGSYTLFVESASRDGEHETIIDGRNTRLGIDVSGPKVNWGCGAQTGGKVEIDFQNSVLST
jgi:hypothetical protein